MFKYLIMAMLLCVMNCSAQYVNPFDPGSLDQEETPVKEKIEN